MGEAIRRVWLASLLLLSCAAASSYVGEWQSRAEEEQKIKRREAGGFHISHDYADPNGWEVIGGALFFAGISVASAALILWRRDSH